MPDEKDNDTWLEDLVRTVREISNTTSRLDERMKIVVEEGRTRDVKLDKIMETVSINGGRISVLEKMLNIEEFKSLLVDVQELKLKSKLLVGRWNNFSAFTIQVLLLIVSAYLGWRLK